MKKSKRPVSLLLALTLALALTATTALAAGGTGETPVLRGMICPWCDSRMSKYSILPEWGRGSDEPGPFSRTVTEQWICPVCHCASSTYTRKELRPYDPETDAPPYVRTREPV